MEDSGIGIAGQPQTADDVTSPLIRQPLTQSVGGGASTPSTCGSPMSQSIDDFTHVRSPRTATSMTKSQMNYSQVVFHDISDLYPTDSDIKCSYTLTNDVVAQPGDKVALFKVGWSSVSEYVTFERAPQPSDDGASLSVTFKAEKLPKDTASLYQLCYVTSGNVVVGASTPLTFHVPTEAELIAVEDPSDPGLVVFRSRVAQLQDALQMKNDDYDQLSLKHKLLEENMGVLKKELDKVDNALKTTKETVTELFTNKQSLEIDNTVLQERLNQFQQETHTIGKLEEQLLLIKKEKDSVDAELRALKSEHEDLVRQFNENKNSYLTVKMENVDLAATMSKNYEALQEKARLVESQASTIECLQQDCERTTKALKEQVKLVESLSSQNETLSEKLRQLAAKHNETVMENIELNKKLSSASEVQADYERLKTVFKETFEAPDVSNVHVARASRLEEEKEMLQAMLENLEEHHAKCQDKINRLTAELHGLNMGGNKSSERRSSDLNDPSSTILEMVRTVASNVGNLIVPQEVKGDKQGSSGPSSPTRSGDSGSKGDESSADLKLKLQAIRQQKSELSTELVSVRHNNSEMEKTLSDMRQETSRKSSRIEVLELELRAAKEELQKSKKRRQDSDGGSLIGDHIEVLTGGLPVINKFNEQVGVLAQLHEKFESEKSDNVELKKKIVDLLTKDAEMCSELQCMKDKYEEMCGQLEEMKNTPQAKIVEQLTMVLEDSEFRRKDAEAKLQQEVENKNKLEQQVTTLRAESVGKVSVDCSRMMQEHINSLEMHLAEMSKFTLHMKKFIHYTFDERRNKPINCPLCPMEFPYSCEKKFAAHFKEQHMRQ